MASKSLRFMGVDLNQLTEQQLARIDPRDRKKLGRRARTRAECLQMETARLERQIHAQFAGFCHRHGVDVWHANPTRKSTIAKGLPDFLCWRSGWAVAIEFKIFPNKPSPEQETRFAELRAHGNAVHVCTESSTHSAYQEAITLITAFFNLIP